MRTLRGTILAAVAVAAGVAFAAAGGDDVVVENARMKLVIGSDARAKSLVVKSTGDEMLDMAQRVIGFRVAHNFLFGGLASLFPDAWGAVVLQVGYIAVCWLFLYFLYRHKVFLKV